MTVQYVRLTAYTRSVARRHRDAGRSRRPARPGNAGRPRAAWPGRTSSSEGGTMSTARDDAGPRARARRAAPQPGNPVVYCRSPQSSSYSVTNVVGSFNGNPRTATGSSPSSTSTCDGNLNGNTIFLVAPARLTPLACALPEGDARQQREGRPGALSGRPSRLRGGPARGRRRAGPFLTSPGEHAREEQA